MTHWIIFVSLPAFTMNILVLRRAFGFLSFIVATVTYLLTVQESVPFWDCGEFTAAAAEQQVPHPPGAPLFLIVGKLFHLLPFGDPGWRVNLLSAFASAVTVGLLYLVIVQVIENFRGKKYESFGDAIAVFGSAFVGATALTFSDTFWFNAVESEVYASSTLLVAIIVWLMMRWNEEADNPGHEKYLLLIAYIIGLSTGVHLFSILAIFSLALVVYFRKYDFKLTSFFVMGAITVLSFGLIYPGIVKVLPSMLGGNLFKTEARDYVIMDSLFPRILAIGTIIGAAFGTYHASKNNKPILNLACSSFLLIILGYSTYTQILLRSNANPPMNENTPNDLIKLSAYLGREQYGDAPSWPRRWQTDPMYTSRHMDYGPWFEPPRKAVTRQDGMQYSVPDFSAMKKNMSGEMSYLFKYQLNHMYLRYFYWNFMGRVGDLQDAPATMSSNKNSLEFKEFNYLSGYKDIFPITFFALPLLLGLFGMVFHFKKQPRMALVYLTLFLLTGLLAAYAQNQQNPQPRERDYFYVGSFFVWCMWIGIGTYGIISTILKRDENFSTAIAGGAIALCFIAVPVNMGMGGWKMHDRSGNFLPFDYSYNVLQSLDKDAIVFTYGDNDTFPLWYMQDVAGVRRDVRVVNLSLGQTGWYMYELKNRAPWGAKKIPLTFSDNSLLADETSNEAIGPELSEAESITIPVSQEILKRFTNDSTILANGVMQFNFNGDGNPRPGEKEDVPVFYKGPQHKLVADIMKVVKFERPVYFTQGADSYMGMDEYLRIEGLAQRVCPVKQGPDQRYEIDIMDKSLLNPVADDIAHTGPHYGFKFRNLNNKEVYYDEVHRRFMDSYRMTFLNYASYQAEEKKDNAKCVKILDAMNRFISPEQFPITYVLEYQIGEVYARAGAKKQAKEFFNRAIESARYIEENRLHDIDRFARNYPPQEIIKRAQSLKAQL
jgi:hypothetical protein